MRGVQLLGMVAALWGATAVGATLTGDTNRPEMSMFIPGEAVELTFKAAGLAPDTKGLKLEVDIVDEHEKQLKRLELPVAPDAKGAWSGMVKAPSDRTGFYRARAKLSNGVTIPAIGGQGDRPNGFITYAVAPDPAGRKLYPAAETVFGMQGGFNQKLQVLPYLGIRWVMGPGSWGREEPLYSGQFADRREEAMKKGEKFPADPFAWCRYKVDGKERLWDTYFFCNSLGSCCLPNKWKTPPYKPETYEIGRAVLSPEGEKQFDSYCRNLAKAMAASYPDQKEHLYEVTWEPELFWKGAPADMVRYYEIAYPALHQEDPKAVVVGPAIHVPDFDYTEQLFKAGLGQYIDMFSLHYSFIGEGFERRNPAGRIRGLKQMIKDVSGKDIPLMNTEFGMNTEAADGDAQLRSSQQEIRAHLVSLGEGFKHIIAFYISAAGGGYFYNLNPNSGCGTNKTGPRPVAPAYAAMTYLLEGHKGAEPIDWLGATSLGYAYENAEDVTLALWDFGDKPNEVVIPLGVEQAKVYDWMGNLTVMPTENGALKLTLGNDPLYVQGVSPLLWGSKAVKPLRLSLGELLLFPGDEGKFTCSANASPGKGLKGVLSVKTGEFLSVSPPTAVIDVPPGGSKAFAFTVKVADDAPAGAYPAPLTLRDGAVVEGVVGCVVKVGNPLKVGRLSPRVEPDGRKSLAFRVEELRGRPCSGTLRLKVAGVPESAKELKFSLGAKERRELVAAYDDLAANPAKKYDVEWKVTLDSGYSYEGSERTDFLSAKRLAKAPAIDGDAADWKDVPFIELEGVGCCPRSPQFYSGDAAKLRYAWDDHALYLLAEVKDDVFMQEQSEDWIWNDDSLQCGFCLEPWKEFRPSADALADSLLKPKQAEINLALTPKGAVATRSILVPKNDKLPCGSISRQDCQFAIVRDGGTTIYEAAFPWTSLGLERAPEPGTHIAVTVAVNDRDTRKQPGPSALSLFDGATGKKDSELMGLLYLEK